MTTQHIPVYGNYHGYYSKRPFVNDPRLTALSKDLFAGKRILDVGCNEGWVTVEIAQKWRAEKVVGVDIDEALIRAAWKRRLAVWSQQAPHSRVEESKDNSRKRKRTEPSSDPVRAMPQPDYFPASLEHMFGSLPVPPSQNRGKNVFPHNISFRTGDWVNDRDAVPEDKEGYDVVIAFSVSKWIHLNGGDEGLRSFFQRVHDVLRPGGVFILEPQPWDTYKKARRMLHGIDSHKHDVELKIRPEDFPAILGEIGFGPQQHVCTTGEEGGFRRPVEMYTRVEPRTKAF